jgi:hypothetical protein
MYHEMEIFARKVTRMKKLLFAKLGNMFCVDHGSRMAYTGNKETNRNQAGE